MELISNTTPIERRNDIQTPDQTTAQFKNHNSFLSAQMKDDLFLEKHFKKSLLKIDEIKDCLRSYGLNPNDWSLLQEPENREKPFLLTHKKDSSFKLLAFLDWQERPVVKDLCVYSV